MPLSLTECIGGFKGGSSGPCPPNLASNKFQDRPSGTSRMQENPTSGAYSAPQYAQAGGERGGCLHSWPFGPRALALRALPLTRNRRHGPSQHDGPPMNKCNTIYKVILLQHIPFA